MRGIEGQQAPERTRRLLRIGAVAMASLLLGGLTFFAQGWLPESFSSLANSASGWALLTALMVFGARLTGVTASIVGAISFVLLVLGYSLAAQLQGLFYSPVLFGVIGIVAGPFVGIATAWLRSSSQLRAAAGAALLSGIGIGEGVYGLTQVAETTSPVYWIVITVAGAALLAGMTFRRLRELRALAVAVVGTAVVAAAFNVAYLAVGSVGSVG
ncbi:DUF6518 family protein [Actinoalloteichus fjordicus]|uniref:Uncharacterized protein n=1 Tax=Actinoalloteichus fjordicus TaxID=1612552 RepID=A0AAC9PUD3_9PSEU|nr:DUF6518 family protein [Actinoalloteichus fjordicus]APU17569.1 hypothetical protein UA74_27840 [Actinoalloteichus fjordicus]